jgi:hypothetical protein
MSTPTALAYQRFVIGAMSHNLGTAISGNVSSWLSPILYDAGYVIHT